MKLIDVMNKQLEEGVNDPGIFKAIFLAGGPGSGKSFVAGEIMGIPQNLSFSVDGLKIVNSDPEFEYFLKKQGIDPSSLGQLSDKEFEKLTVGPGSPREKAKKVKQSKEKLYVQGRLGLLIDGTGDDYAKIKKKRQELVKYGYDTYMIFINTTLDVAQERNATRDRVLPEKMVKDIWTAVQKNLGRFQGLFKQNFIIVDNTEKRVAKRENDNKLFEKHIYTAIKRFMRTPIKSGIAQKWIKQQGGR